MRHIYSRELCLVALFAASHAFAHSEPPPQIYAVVDSIDAHFFEERANIETIRAIARRITNVLSPVEVTSGHFTAAHIVSNSPRTDCGSPANHCVAIHLRDQGRQSFRLTSVDSPSGTSGALYTQNDDPVELAIATILALQKANIPGWGPCSLIDASAGNDIVYPICEARFPDRAAEPITRCFLKFLELFELSGVENQLLLDGEPMPGATVQHSLRQPRSTLRELRVRLLYGNASAQVRIAFHEPTCQIEAMNDGETRWSAVLNGKRLIKPVSSCVTGTEWKLCGLIPSDEVHPGEYVVHCAGAKGAGSVTTKPQEQTAHVSSSVAFTGGDCIGSPPILLSCHREHYNGVPFRLSKLSFEIPVALVEEARRQHVTAHYNGQSCDFEAGSRTFECSLSHEQTLPINNSCESARDPIKITCPTDPGSSGTPR